MRPVYAVILVFEILIRECLHTPVTSHYIFHPAFCTLTPSDSGQKLITLCPCWRTHIIYCRWCQIAHKIAQQRCIGIISVFFHPLLVTIGHVDTPVCALLRCVLCLKRHRQFTPDDTLHDGTDVDSSHIIRPISSTTGPIHTLPGSSPVNLTPLVQAPPSELACLHSKHQYRYIKVKFFIRTRRTHATAATSTSPRYTKKCTFSIHSFSHCRPWTTCVSGKQWNLERFGWTDDILR